MLVIRRIHVTLKLAAPEEARETVERVHGMYAMRCPLYRTLHTAIAPWTLKTTGCDSPDNRAIRNGPVIRSIWTFDV